jgi:uncharacterized protein YcbX
MERAEGTERIVGRVVAIYRYPVKSMRGHEIAATQVRRRGLEGDRRYAFVRSDDRSGFPWLTARQVAAMLRYEPYFAEPADPGRSPVRVRTPDGRDLAVESDELRDQLAAAYGAPAALLQLNVGAMDAAPVSLIGTASVAALGAAAGRAIDARRFRPNLVVEPLDGQPFAEEAWLGGSLIFGERPDSARVRADDRDERCMMINLDPETAVQQPEVLRTVARSREQCTGIYGSVEAPGTIEVGDEVRLVRG